MRTVRHHLIRVRRWLLFFAAVCSLPALAAPGEVDASPDPDIGGDGFPFVYSTAVQTDGKIVIGGSFTVAAGMGRTNLARLNADGSLDPGFNPRIGDDSAYVDSVAIQVDGKIIVSGRFTNVNATARNNLARLNADGSLDPGFNPDVRGTRSPFVFSTVQADGKIIISGNFITVGGTAQRYLARLNTDGTLDTSFTPEVGDDASYVDGITLQSDGKVLIGGLFTTVNGTERHNFARLNTDGTLDAGFNPDVGGARSPFVFSAVQADGRIIIGGNFTVVGGVGRTNLARLKADGTLDPGFNPNPDDWILSAVIQADGKIVIGGFFSTVGGTPRSSLARLNADGTLDITFDPGANGFILSTALQPDGKIIIGGSFTTVGGMTRNRLARLQNETATQLLRVPGANRVEWWRGGTSPETQDVTFDLSTDDGATWTALGAATRIFGGWELNGLNLPATGQVRARARLIGGQYNGSSSLIETTAAFLSSVQFNCMLRLDQGAFRFGFSNVSGLSFTALASTNLSLPSSEWTVLGPAREVSPGHFEFTDPDAITFPWRFYQVRSP